MNSIDFLETGLQLARELENEAMRHHVKSDDHEVLLWEAAIVEERVQAMRENRPLRENLRESVLMGKWGERTAVIAPELYKRVCAFHQEYEKRRA